MPRPPAPPWTPEQVTDVERARRLLRRHVPEVDVAPHDAVVPLGIGYDNTVFLVAGRWVFRFPRRAQALPLNEREALLLPLVAAVVPLPVPRPSFVGVMDDVPAVPQPWRFFGGPLVPGVELATAAVPDAERGPLATALGRGLGVLHGLGAETTTRLVEHAGLLVDPNGRGRPRDRRQRTDDVLRELVAGGLWQPGDDRDRAAQDLLDAADDCEPPAQPEELVLVHGDLHQRHLLVAPDHTAAGLIDWGDACLADASLDLSIGWSAFSGAPRRAFLEAYADAGGVAVTEERALRAQALGFGLAVMLASYAHAVGDEPLLVETLAGARRALD